MEFEGGGGEEEEFQEAEILWPDSASGRFNCMAQQQQLELRRSNRSKKRRKSRPAETMAIKAQPPISYSWSPGLVFEDEVDGDRGWIVMPPHALVDRRDGEKAAFSVCTGSGRTLKGRDQRRVREAVLRMTGFCER